jgi:hypothetical protein
VPQQDRLDRDVEGAAPGDEGYIEGGPGLSTRLPDAPDSGFRSSTGRIGGSEDRTVHGAIGTVGSSETTRGPDDPVEVEEETPVEHRGAGNPGSVTGGGVDEAEPEDY